MYIVQEYKLCEQIERTLQSLSIFTQKYIINGQPRNLQFKMSKFTTSVCMWQATYIKYILFALTHFRCL